jgi:hypothetical protein
VSRAHAHCGETIAELQRQIAALEKRIKELQDQVCLCVCSGQRLLDKWRMDTSMSSMCSCVRARAHTQICTCARQPIYAWLHSCTRSLDENSVVWAWRWRRKGGKMGLYMCKSPGIVVMKEQIADMRNKNVGYSRQLERTGDTWYIPCAKASMCACVGARIVSKDYYCSGLWTTIL